MYPLLLWGNAIGSTLASLTALKPACHIFAKHALNFDGVRSSCPRVCSACMSGDQVEAAVSTLAKQYGAKQVKVRHQAGFAEVL